MAKRFVSRSNSLSVRRLGPKTTRGNPWTNYAVDQTMLAHGSHYQQQTWNRSFFTREQSIHQYRSRTLVRTAKQDPKEEEIYFTIVFSLEEPTNITPETSHIHRGSIDRLNANPICTSLRLFCNERRGISTIQNYIRSWAAESLRRYDPLEEFQYAGAFVISGYSSDSQQTNRPFVSFLGETFECVQNLERRSRMAIRRRAGGPRRRRPDGWEPWLNL